MYMKLQFSFNSSNVSLLQHIYSVCLRMCQLMHGKLSGPIPYYSLGFLQRIYIKSREFCQTSSDLYVPNKDVSVFHKCTCKPVSVCRSKYLLLVLCSTAWSTELFTLNQLTQRPYKTQWFQQMHMLEWHQCSWRKIAERFQT